MSKFKGDYMGFTYNGIHSSDLGIVRTSDGSRFNENLLPTSQDKTVQVPGRDGTYYFGSYYTQKPINVSFAFDNLSEQQIEFLKMHFGDKKPHPLVFDEVPYKTYMAKVTGTATIKHIPFDENDARVYKGEGTIQFTCYQPYAICDKKYGEDYPAEGRHEWLPSSGLLFQKDGYDKIDGQGRFKVYNPGAIGADWVLTVNVVGTQFPGGLIECDEGYLNFKGGLHKGDDSRITFNSKTGLIEGWRKFEENKYQKSGNIYNDYIVSGDFFKIPITATRTLGGDGWDRKDTFLSVGTNMITANPVLNYSYYYL